MEIDNSTAMPAPDRSLACSGKLKGNTGMTGTAGLVRGAA